jgi:predicted Zn-dependent protease with MMP-like domain
LRLRHNHVSVESLSDEQCREAVREALDSLPAAMRERLGDVAVLHEIGHLFGLDEHRLRELGYG